MKQVYIMNKDFESHFLSLPFHDKEAAQKCLDACDFNVHQNAYIPNAKWFLDNDSDEGVIYCCMLNTAYLSWQPQQKKVEELENDTSLMLASHKRMSVGLLQQQDKIEKLTKERDELQKRVDTALRHLDDVCFPPDYEDAWDSFYKAEKALKGGNE